MSRPLSIGQTLSRREARMVAVLVLLALVAAIWLAVVQPVLAGFAGRAAERDQLTLQRAANERAIAAIPRLRRAAQAHDRAARDAALVAPDAATATGLLRDRLQAALIAAGGAFRGAEDLPPGAGRVACRLHARLSPDQLVQFLASAQNARPALVITAFTVEAGDALVTGRASDLDIQLDASIPVILAPTR